MITKEIENLFFGILSCSLFCPAKKIIFMIKKVLFYLFSEIIKFF